MRLWVMENGLIDQVGHHFNNSVGLRDECARRGLEVRFLVHRRAQPEVIRALDARPVFHFRPYDQLSTGPLAGPLRSWIIQARDFAGGFGTAISDGLAAEDLVLVPTALQSEVFGCALALRRLAPGRRPRIVLNLLMENFLARGSRRPGIVAPLYRFAARALLRGTSQDRLLFAANGREMAESFAQVLAHPVGVYPIPKTYPVPAPPAPNPRQGPPKVAILGHSRPEKGFQFIPEVVARRQDLRFVIQVSPPQMQSLWKDAPIDLRSAANVEFTLGSLDLDAYHALLYDADIVLLPYDPVMMPFRASGVFSEAVAAGKVVVAPAQTWMAGHLDAGRASGVVFDTSTPDCMVDALDRAVRRLPELRARAVACAPAWRAEQCTSAYLDCVLERFGLGASGF